MSIRTIKPKGKTSNYEDGINEGVGLGAAMKGFGWKRKQGQVVTLGGNGSQILGLKMDGAGKFGGGETESCNPLWGEGVNQ